MPHLKNKYLIIVICGLFIAYLALIYLHSPKTKNEASLYARLFSKISSTSPTPSALLAATLSPSPESLSCLDEQAVTTIVGSNYQLQSQQFFPDALILECKYQADQQINTIYPTLSYLLRTRISDAQTLWQTQQATDASSSAYRRIEEDPSLFADVNPVKELSQVTFYGFNKQSYLQLDYTPVKEEIGIQLRKGTQLSQQVLKTSP